MIKYRIEGGEELNFQEQLLKSISDYQEEKNDAETKCLITGEPLTETCMKLDCGHSFHYEALYMDMYNQKFKNYEINNATYSKIYSGIICPYCRSLHNGLLPYYDHLPFKRIYGINTNDQHYKVVKLFNQNVVYLNTVEYFIGKCNYMNGSEACCNNYVILYETLNQTYCSSHIHIIKKETIQKEKWKQKQLKKEEQIQKKLLKKAELMKEKLLEKQEKTKQKLLEKEELKKQKLLEKENNKQQKGLKMISL